MKNNFYKILLAVVWIFFVSVPAFALNLSPEVKTVAVKFGLAMAGVFLFSFILYLGLAIYNKFFVDEQIKDFRLRKDSLRTPSDKDEAIMMFIAKNKIR